MTVGAAGATASGGTEERSAPDQMAFKARALAQTHPLTAVAKGFIDHAVEGERSAQPGPGVGMWVAACLLHGYCLRRVEEDVAGLVLEAVPGAEVDLDQLDAATTRIAAAVRGDGEDPWLADSETVVAALDRIIASEVGKRLDQWGGSLDYQATAEFEDFVTWWVVRGYALRAAEVETGAAA